MKILKIKVSGLPLFKDECEIDFLTKQRVTAKNSDGLSCSFFNGSNSYYQNNVISFIGINASGKTTVLKLITFVCGLLNNEPINNMNCSEIFDELLENKQVVFDNYFYADNKTVNKLHTVIERKNGKLIISAETLTSKPTSKIQTKKALFDFSEGKIILSRSVNEEFLLDDVSIVVALNKKLNKRIEFTNMLRYTNTNQLSITEDYPLELIAFFDSSIEYLKVNRGKKNTDTKVNRLNENTDIRLKFRGKKELVLSRLSELNRYLSSGTIKGINVFLSAVKTFKTGGYLIVDELENHFNHEIVSTLIRFYMDKKVNPKGATLIFSTHYSELLDEFERNDCIYIVRNNNGIKAENLSDILKRNDIKKSEAYQSGFLDGTVPTYDAYIKLKDSLVNTQKGQD